MSAHRVVTLDSTLANLGVDSKEQRQEHELRGWLLVITMVILVDRIDYFIKTILSRINYSVTN